MRNRVFITEAETNLPIVINLDLVRLMIDDFANDRTIFVFSKDHQIISNESYEHVTNQHGFCHE